MLPSGQGGTIGHFDPEACGAGQGLAPDDPHHDVQRCAIFPCIVQLGIEAMTTFTPALEQLNVYLFQLINAPAAVSAGMLRVGTFFASDAVALFPLVLLFNWFWRGEAQKKVVLYALFSMLLALVINIAISMVWQHPDPVHDSV